MATEEAREQTRIEILAKFKGLEDIRRGKAAMIDAAKGAEDHNRVVARSGVQVNDTLLAMASRYIAVGTAIHTAAQAFTGFAAMDNRLRQLQIQTGATWQEIQNLIPKFREWAKASGRSIDEVIEGFDYLRERARLSKEDAAEVFNAVQMGAKATNTNLVDMSKAVGSFMLNMGLAKNEVLPVMDMLTKASKDHMFTVSELAGAIPRLSSTMKNWGYTGVDGAARMTAQIAVLQKTFGDTNDSADALLRLYALMGNEQIAAAAQLTPEGMIRTLKSAKERGEDVMTVFVKLIELGMSRGLQLELLGKREKEIIIAMINSWGEYRGIISSVKSSVGETATAIETLNKSPMKSLDDLGTSFRNLRDEAGHFMNSLGGGHAITGFIAMLDSLAQSLEKISNLFSMNEKTVNRISAARKKLGLPESDYERVQREEKEKEKAATELQEGIRKEREGPAVGPIKPLPQPYGPPVGPIKPRFRLAPEEPVKPPLPTPEGAQPWMKNKPGLAIPVPPEPVPEVKAEPPGGPAQPKPPRPRRTGGMLDRSGLPLGEKKPPPPSGDQPVNGGGFTETLRALREATDPTRLIGPDMNTEGGFLKGVARDAGKYLPWAFKAGNIRLTPTGSGVPRLRVNNIFRRNTGQVPISEMMPGPMDMPAPHLPPHEMIRPPPPVKAPELKPLTPELDMSKVRDQRSELERPIKLRVERDLGETQFRRMSLRREAEREAREARWLSFMDIGAA